MKEAQHGINVGLEDFDRFSTENPVERPPGGGIQVLVEKEAAQSAKETERRNINLEKGVGGLGGETIEYLFRNTTKGELSHGNVLPVKILLDDIDGSSGTIFGKTEIECGAKSCNITAKRDAGFSGAEQMDNEFTLLRERRWFFGAPLGLNLIIVVGMRFIGQFANIFLFGFDAHVARLKIE